MPRVKPLCRPNCPRRCPGCHNPETCPDWNAYLQRKSAYDSTMEAVRAEQNMMHDYGATRYQNLKGRIQDA